MRWRTAACVHGMKDRRSRAGGPTRSNGPVRSGGPERILLVCSPGGHLLQLLALEPACHGFETTWVTLDGPDAKSLLAGRRVVVGFGPTNRSLLNLVRNLRLAWGVIGDHDPQAILSTGAGLAVAFLAVGKLRGRRCVYVESLTRIESLSLSGRLVRPFADAFFVQWPTAARNRGVRFAGSILG